MSKKSSSGSSLARIILFLVLLTGLGFYFYTNPNTVTALLKNPQIKGISGSVKGLATSIDTTKIKTKLVNPPQILNTTQEIAVDSGLINEGESLENLSSELTQKIKSLPKDQAKTIIKNTCQQIIENIDSAY